MTTPKTVEDVVKNLTLELSYGGRGNVLDDTMSMDSVEDLLRQTLTDQNQAADERLRKVVGEILKTMYGVNDRDYLQIDRKDVEKIIANHGITNL